MSKRTEDLRGWLTKLQAAEILGRSPKAVERMGVAGKLEVRYVRRELDGAKIALYNPKDVERMRRALHPEAPPFVEPKEGETLPVLGRPNGMPLEVQQALVLLGQGMAHIAEVLKQREPPKQIEAPGTSPTLGHAVPLAERVYLTVQEAAAFSGLPQVDLRRLVQAEQLAVFRTGRGGIRIRREALEKL